MPFVCSICEEAASQICVRCTKDACANHICEKCHRCSDCCECELSLQPPAPAPVVRDLPGRVAADPASLAPEPPASPEEPVAPGEPGVDAPGLG